MAALPIDILAFLFRYQMFAYYYLELFCVIGLPTLDKKKCKAEFELYEMYKTQLLVFNHIKIKLPNVITNNGCNYLNQFFSGHQFLKKNPKDFSYR